MKLKIEEKIKAINLRTKGFSLGEIVKNLGVSKSSVSTWVRNTHLDKKARTRLLTKIKFGQLKASENKRQKTIEKLKKYKDEAGLYLKQLNIDKVGVIICALIYWCEGAKDRSRGVSFTNSDPKLVRTFLILLRCSYDLDESKFRVCVHLHGYHNSERQIAFWSKVTNISMEQFIKPYNKPNTGKRIRLNYQGCVSIRYHSNDLAKKLLMMGEAFLDSHGSVN